MSTHADSRTYTIMETAKLSGLPESTLRYYESIGLIQPVKRDASSKHRVYSEQDLNAIDAIACLNATGMALGDMRNYMQNAISGANKASEQIELLKAQQQRLENEAKYMKVQQQYVGLKIKYWKAVEAGDEAKVQEISAEARKLANILKVPKQK